MSPLPFFMRTYSVDPFSLFLRNAVIYFLLVLQFGLNLEGLGIGRDKQKNMRTIYKKKKTV